jgi:hypothetical protein
VQRAQILCRFEAGETITEIARAFVRRQLFLRIGDNYFSRLTTITLYSLAARSAGRQAQGEAPPAAVFFV